MPSAVHGPSDVLLVLGGAGRAGSRIDWPPTSASGASLEAALGAAGTSGLGSTLTLCGGEITLRADLPELIRGVSELGQRGLGIWTDGLALASDGAVSSLRRAGLERVVIPLHAGRADAHDWLCGAKGAASRTTRAIRTCLDAGLVVDAELVVTRPTTPYLQETVEVLSRLHVRGVRFRRLVARGPAAPEFIMLSPRFGLLEPYLEAALRACDELRLHSTVIGFPACVLGPAAARAARPSERYVCVDEQLAREWRLGGVPSAGACARCPGAPACAGAPEDYVERFGWAELRAAPPPGEPPRADAEPAQAGAPVAPPPPRGGRPPATRVAFSVAQAARPSLDGDPAPGGAREPAASLRLEFRAPSPVRCSACGDRQHAPAAAEPTRGLRARLVSAAQVGAKRLRIASAGSLAHPEWIELLRETKRLAVPSVELVCEGSALGQATGDELQRLRHVSRVDIALYGPDAASHDAHAGIDGAFEAALAGLRTWASVAPTAVGSFAVLHDEAGLDAYERGWSSGLLPGSPAFRLSEQGSSLEALANAARRLPEGPTRSALAAVLPPCLLERAERAPCQPPAEAIWAGELERPAPPSGSDRLGRYLPCLNAKGCRITQCPGIAVGWTSSLPSS